MASAGKILIRIIGDWVSGGNYKVIDITYFDGSSYIAKRDIVNSTITPKADTENWQLFCKGIGIDEDVVTKDMAMSNADINTILES